MTAGELESQAFCPQCGVGIVFDEDGCCATCGADTCSMLQLRNLLDTAKLYVVSIDDKAALDALAVTAIAVYRDGRRRFLHEAQEQAVCEAELARRGSL